MKRIAFLASVAVAAVMAACSCCNSGSCPVANTDSVSSNVMDQADMAAQAISFDPAMMAGTYVGTIPAADRPGFEITLELRADGTAHMTEKVVGEEAAQNDFDGTVTFSTSMPQFIVQGGPQPYYFNFADGNLLMVSADGTEPEMRDQYMLRRQ